MSSRWTGFFVWFLVAASAAFWGMRVFTVARALPTEARVPSRPVAANSPMTRLFGALPAADEAAAPPAESERFQLQGVIADGSSGQAIVSIDGQPPRSWRVGAAVEGDTTLLSVSRRSAEFGPRGGPAAFTLELPAPVAAATGTLPVAAAGNTPVAARPGPVPNGGFQRVPGMNLPGGVNRGPNGLPFAPPRAMPIQQPQQMQPQENQVQRDEE
jgi:general secretion pathway protein C